MEENKMNKAFWKAAGVRALRTVCQTAIALIGTSVVLSDVNWITLISGSLLSGFVSILTSVATGLPEVDSINAVTLSEQNGMEKEDEK